MIRRASWIGPWIVILAVLAALGGLGFGIWKFFGFLFSGGLLAWWQTTFRDPVFDLILETYVFARGNVLLGLIPVVIAHRAAGIIFSSAPQFVLGLTPRVSLSAEARAVTRVRSSLESVFAGDQEKMALYQNRLYSTEVGERAKKLSRGTILFTVGCWLGILWFIVMAPLTGFFTIAILSGLLRFYAQQESFEIILEAAGDLGPKLMIYMPIQDSFYGISLSSSFSFQNLWLIFVSVILILARWLINNYSVSGRNWPSLRMISRWNLVAFAAYIVLLFVFINGALLVYLVMFKVSWVSSTVVRKFFVRGLYLRLRRLLLILGIMTRSLRSHEVEQ